MSGKRCESIFDCGGTVTELKCKKNSVYQYTTTYRCKNAGTPESLCIGKIREKVVTSCEEYEDCQRGICVPIYLNECDQRCDNGGFSGFYCSSSCGSDPEVQMSGDCNDEYRRCCCRP